MPVSVWSFESSSWAGRLAFDDLVLAHGDRPTPPALSAGGFHVSSGDPLLVALVRERERHVLPRGEVRLVVVPVVPLLRGRARGGQECNANQQCRSRQSAHHQRTSQVAAIVRKR